jgi:hypothetical protein
MSVVDRNVHMRLIIASRLENSPHVLLDSESLSRLEAVPGRKGQSPELGAFPWVFSLNPLGSLVSRYHGQLGTDEDVEF